MAVSGSVIQSWGFCLATGLHRPLIFVLSQCQQPEMPLTCESLMAGRAWLGVDDGCAYRGLEGLMVGSLLSSNCW